jgi:protein-export membrane protein SecD
LGLYNTSKYSGMAGKYQRSRIKTFTRSQVAWRAAGSAVLFLLCLVVAAPTYANRGIDAVNKATNLGIPTLPAKGFNLGLDLQGGAHLIYEAKTDRIAPADRGSSVEGVRDVIERRVRGGLGVAEPLVQTTQVGDAHRIIVELPGVTDVNQAIKMIGETPVLEFKEENTEPPRELTAEEKKQMASFNKGVDASSTKALAEIRSGVPFADVVTKYSQDERTKNNGGDLGFISADQQPELYAWAKKQKDGAVTSPALKTEAGVTIAKRFGEQPGEKEVSAAHILICYKGAASCTGTLSKKEALAKAQDLKNQAKPENFAELAKVHSTEPGASQSGGDLGTFKKSAMVEEFANAVFAMPVGAISDPVETQFGYHLIYKKAENTPLAYKVAHIFLKYQQKTDIIPPTEGWKSTGLSGKQLKRAEVVQDERTGQIQVSLQFNDEGSKLFGEITTRNVGKPVGIFLDGHLESSPRVNEPITTGSAVITGSYTLQEARKLSRDLNTGALPVPVELISQEKVDATLGADSLNKSFKAGVVGLLLVMIFMVLYYRLPGLLSVFSLAVYAALNLALFKLMGVTLTLAGIAGFILSIGMAVDANILVFERLKEELKAGKSLGAALPESFARAWPSIRDSHVTALISCVFLIWFGSGFIQGFAVILAMGTLINLFTAITVTRNIMRLVLGWFTRPAKHFFLGGN